MDLVHIVANLRRPALLVRAARAGLIDYNRRRDLLRVMKTTALPSPGQAVSSLLAEEERLEETRRKGDAAYSFARHIDVLIAMMAEVRLLPRTEVQG